jgi:hypothetical protein
MAACMPEFLFLSIFIIESLTSLFLKTTRPSLLHFFVKRHFEWKNSPVPFFYIIAVFKRNTLIFGSDDGGVGRERPDNPIQIAGLSLTEESGIRTYQLQRSVTLFFDYNFYSYVTDASFVTSVVIDNIYTRSRQQSFALSQRHRRWLIRTERSAPPQRPPPATGRACPARWPILQPSTSVSFRLSTPAGHNWPCITSAGRACARW